MAALWHLAAAAAILAASFGVTLNTDVWFHLAAGRLIWEQRAVPAVDTWSYTAAGRPWINHEWLSDLIFHAWARLFGLDALVVWQGLVLLAAFLLLFRFLHRLSGSYLASFLVLAFTLLVAAPFFDLRPQLWSLLAFVLLLELALACSGPPWLLPVLFLCWSNLHAGVVFGLGVLALLVVTRALAARTGLARTGPAQAGGRRDGGDPEDGNRCPPGRLAGAGLAALAASLINPFGAAIVTYPMRLLRPSVASRQLISEWQSPLAAGGLQSPYYFWAVGAWVVAALVVLALGEATGSRRVRWGALAVGAITLAMSLESRRFIPLFALAASLQFALAARGLLRRRWRGARAAAAPRGWALAAGPPALAILGGLAVLWPHLALPHPFWRTTMGTLQPVDTLNFVEANGLSGKVFAYFAFSGYVDYRTMGRLAVFVDPRSETVFSDRTQQAYSRVQYQVGDWRSTLEDSGAQWVLWSRFGWDQGRLPRELEASGRWRRVHQDARSVLLARSDVALPASPREAPPSAYRDWAAAQDAYAARDLQGAEALLERAVAERPELAGAWEDLISVQKRRGEDGAAAATAARSASLLREIKGALMPAGP